MWGRGCNSDLVSGSEEKRKHARKNRELHRKERLLLFLLAWKRAKKTQRPQRTRHFRVGDTGVGRGTGAGEYGRRVEREPQREKSGTHAPERHSNGKRSSCPLFCWAERPKRRRNGRERPLSSSVRRVTGRRSPLARVRGTTETRLQSRLQGSSLHNSQSYG